MGWIKPKKLDDGTRKPSECEAFEAKRERSGIHSLTAKEDATIKRRKKRIKAALKEQLAIGKIDRARYNSLKKRMNDISDELVVFGESAGVILGTKYVCGVLDKEDFDQIKCDFLPVDLEEEKSQIISEIEKRKESLRVFKEVCSHDKNVCQKCHCDKGLFSSLKKVEGMKLCNSCFNVYEKHKHFDGYHGKYIIASPTEIDEDTTPTFTLREDAYN